MLALVEFLWSPILADQGTSHAKDSCKRNQSPIQREITQEKPNSAYIKLYVIPKGLMALLLGTKGFLLCERRRLLSELALSFMQSHSHEIEI